jgi:hypothetical protein
VASLYGAQRFGGPRLWSTKRLADTSVIANYDVAAEGAS